ISAELAGTWLDRGYRAVAYWLERLPDADADGDGERDFVMMRLRVMLEVTARFVIRADAERAIDIFKMAVGLAERAEIQHFWLHKAFGHLVHHSLSAIPPDRQQDVLLDALRFPLIGRIAEQPAFSRWPNPVITRPGARGHCSASTLQTAIADLIEQVRMPKQDEGRHEARVKEVSAALNTRRVALSRL